MVKTFLYIIFGVVVPTITKEEHSSKSGLDYSSKSPIVMIDNGDPLDIMWIQEPIPTTPVILKNPPVVTDVNF